MIGALRARRFNEFLKAYVRHFSTIEKMNDMRLIVHQSKTIGAAPAQVETAVFDIDTMPFKSE